MGWSISKFRVDIQNTRSSSSFRPGQTIHGTLYIVNGKPCKHLGILIQCTGYADETRVTMHTVDEEEESLPERVYHLKLYHIISEQGKLAAGDHIFPFSFELPKLLPSSSNRIKYKVTGHMIGDTMTKQCFDDVTFDLHGNCSYAQFRVSQHGCRICNHRSFYANETNLK